MSIETPLVLIIFNRPQLAQRVFAAIRAARPKQLLVIADGPRADRPGERERCDAARAIVEQIDWPCEVRKNYSDTNLGCGVRIAGGIDWVFSQVSEAIILEDDCVPDPTFFPYCQTLLERYRDDQRVMHISGNNFQGGISRTDCSYYFSKYSHNWGWATWRRAWGLNDYRLELWPAFKASGLLRSVCPNPEEAAMWTRSLDRIAAANTSVWDVQWQYSCWANSGMSILPDVNLVSNIGFGADATHTTSGSRHEIVAALPTVGLGDIRHPRFYTINAEADRYTLNTVFGIPNPSTQIGLRQIAAAFRNRLRAALSRR